MVGAKLAEREGCRKSGEDVVAKDWDACRDHEPAVQVQSKAPPSLAQGAASQTGSGTTDVSLRRCDTVMLFHEPFGLE